MCNGTVSEWSKECDSSENLPLVKGLLIYVCRQGFESPRCHTFWSLQFETLTTPIYLNPFGVTVRKDILV